MLGFFFSRGFTLLELLIAMVLIILLAALAVPSFHSIMIQSRISTQVTQLVVGINLARSEAVTRHQVVALCASQDGKACQGTWQNGWIVFVDKQKSGKVDPGDQVLRIFDPSSGNLTWSGNKALQLNSDGSVRGASGTFTYYPDKSKSDIHAKVIVSLTGRVRVEKE